MVSDAPVRCCQNGEIERRGSTNVNFRRRESVNNGVKVISRTRVWISCQIKKLGGSLRNRLHINLLSARKVRMNDSEERKKTNPTDFGCVWQRPLD